MDALLAAPATAPLLERWARDRVVDALRRAQEEVRARIGAGEVPDRLEDPDAYVETALELLAGADVPSLKAVINAAGVVLHTNLGRAPLAPAALEAMRRAGRGYANLEFDLPEGRRGSRYAHCVSLLTELTGAADALVVNNNAAALVLALNTVALGRPVVVSRGELVEIGGGFRIPEILERSGVRLLEVGSTNRTRLSDYRQALEEHDDVAAVLKVHRSNFRISGFTEEASLEELAGLAGGFDVPLLHDLGSGLFVAPDRLGLPEEPRAAEALSAGADLVAVSGDKLLGGPQAGLLVGREELVSALRANPLCRALRVGKVTLAGLEATLRLHRDPDAAIRGIPALAMLAARPGELEERARSLAARLVAAGVEVEVLPGTGAVGGGTYPGLELPDWTVRVTASGGTEALARALRTGSPPVVGRIEEGRVVLSLRTVLPDEEDALVARVAEAAGTET